MLPPPNINADLEQKLDELPDKVADALLEWRKAIIMREKTEALLFLKLKGGEEKRTVAEIEALVESNDERCGARLDEAIAESNYERLKERHLSNKKLAEIRTAY